MAGVRAPLRPTKSYGRASRTDIIAFPNAARPPLRPTKSCGDTLRPGVKDHPFVAVRPNHPIVAARPILKPSVSFGGESRMSYYPVASSTLESRSQVVAAKEQLVQRQQRIDVRENTSGKVFAWFGIPCLQRYLTHTTRSMTLSERQGLIGFAEDVAALRHSSTLASSIRAFASHTSRCCRQWPNFPDRMKNILRTRPRTQSTREGQKVNSQ